MIKEPYPLKKEISSLKSRLTKLNEEKKLALKEKRVFSKGLSELINQIKELKNKTDKENKIVEGHKAKRDECNKEAGQLISELKQLDKEKNELYEKQNIKIDPIKIKEKITKLEESIEIEGYTFEKEQKVMEQIKKLKRLYSEFATVSVVLDKIKNISDQIRKKKEEAKKCHNQLLAFSKSGEFNNFIQLSKKINELKAENESYTKKYLEKKDEYQKINESLNEKLIELNKIQKEKEDVRKKSELEKKRLDDATLSKKIKSVEEKLKKEKKLTTEDLLVFQKE